MRSSRLLAILILLQLRGRLTADQLAAEFEVSVRTIYRDMDALSAAGVPLYGDAGPGGGFALLDGYRTRLTGLDHDEERALPFIALPDAASALGLGPAAATARHKLLAALPGTGGGLAARTAAAFHADVAEWYQATESAVHLPLLLTAILDQRPVTMDYVSWTGQRRWTIDPLGLVLKGGRYYCLARARGRLTTFRVAEMRTVVTLEGRFDRPSDFDLTREWARARDAFEASLRNEVATLRLSPLGARRLAETGPYAQQAVAAASAPDSSGWCTVALPVEPPEQSVRLLLSLGGEVEVLGPAHLRAEMARLAAAIAQRHSAKVD